jgi:hypothetical protein
VDREIEADLVRFRQEFESFENANRQRMEWSARESRHRRKLEALVQLMADRAAEVNEPLPEEVATRAATSSIGYIQPIRSETVSERRPEPISIGQIPQSLTEFVRQVLYREGPGGLSPANIRKLAQAKGIMDLSGNFPYTILHKLKTKGEIREENGTYYSNQKRALPDQGTPKSV